ncbi:MAG: ribonuclease HI family protein [Actinomycetota bacterium]
MIASLDASARNGGIVALQGQAEGEAAIGAVLKDPGGSLLHQISARIGWAPDHHVAEYQALIAGLRLARGHGVDRIRVFLDSAVVVNQVNGDWKVKEEHFKPLVREAHTLVREFTDIQISLVGRKGNAEAHTLADKALAPIR